MVAEIRWSDNAVQDYQTIVEYLVTNWHHEVASRFIEVVEYRVKQLSIHPGIGMRSLKFSSFRSILVTKHNRLYYQVILEQIIEITVIIDTRQDPSQNRFE